MCHPEPAQSAGEGSRPCLTGSRDLLCSQTCPGRSVGCSSTENCSSPSVPQLVPDDAPQRLNAVFPGDFLPLFVSSSRVTDRDLVDTPVAFGDLRRNLRLEPEPVGLYLDTLQHFAAEGLVAGLHIGEFQVCSHVREQG